MTHTSTFARRTARLRALTLVAAVFAFNACGNPDRITHTSAGDAADQDASVDPASLAADDEGDATGGMPIADEDEGVLDEEEIGVEVVDGSVAPESAALAVEGLTANAYRGGMPFGTFHLPLGLHGRTYTGSIANISAHSLVSHLETARRNGARVMISFSGNEAHFKNRNRSFSMEKWKHRVNRYRRLNLTSFIRDGTLIGHYLFDEPHDPANWGGRTVPRATIDEMARYSKQVWPGLPTVVRAWPKYLKGYRYRYLDAAWAQYSARFGPVAAFMRNNVRDAKASGLALVIGMNQLNGGNRAGGLRGFSTGYAMTASQLRSWGSQMLSDPYPCAFLSWQYNARYMNRSDIKAAKAQLAAKARSKGSKSCRGGRAATSAGGGGGGGSSGNGDDDDDDNGSGAGAGSGSGGGGSSSITLRVKGRAEGGRQRMTLAWSGLKGSTADVYRNGSRIERTPNDGRYVNVRRFRGRISYTYKICQKGTRTCSRAVSVSFR
jgi:hypothetical protein